MEVVKKGLFNVQSPIADKDGQSFQLHPLLFHWMQYGSHLSCVQEYGLETVLRDNWFYVEQDEIHQLVLRHPNQKTYIILFVHPVRLSFKDFKPIPTLYEVVFHLDDNLKADCRLFRLSQERLNLVGLSGLPETVRGAEYTNLVAFKESYAELTMKIFDHQSSTILEIQDRSKTMILSLHLSSLEVEQIPLFNQDLSVSKPSKKDQRGVQIPELLDQVVANFNHQYGKSHKQSSFVELELDLESIKIHEKTKSIDYNTGKLIPVLNQNGQRAYKELHVGAVIVGIRTDDMGIGIPIKRVLIIGDLAHPRNAVISSIECTLINAAIRYAAKEELPIDWFAASYGVEISADKGVESLDASASTAREIVKYASHHGVPINVIIDSENIGAQVYWNALATIVQESRGILIMTEQGTMALTGHRALVSALYSKLHSLDISTYTKKLFPEGLRSLGGYASIYGPNAEAMIGVPDLKAACEALMHHHYYSYQSKLTQIVSCRKRPKAAAEKDLSVDMDQFKKEITALQSGLKPNEQIILNYLKDPNFPPPLRFWQDAQGIQDQSLEKGRLSQKPSTIVQEMIIGSRPTMVIFPPVGPLTPFDSLIIAKAIYKANGRLPVLIIGNLTGFNSDPLSMQNSQLFAGSSIVKAIVDHEGPIIIVNLGCLIGGSYVVFSKELNPQLHILALEGARIQVVGGHIATKIIFHSKILKEARKFIEVSSEALSNSVKHSHPHHITAHKGHPGTSEKSIKGYPSRLNEIDKEMDSVLRRLVEEFEKWEASCYDKQHTVERALQLGAIDEIISIKHLKKAIIRHREEILEAYPVGANNVEDNPKN